MALIKGVEKRQTTASTSRWTYKMENNMKTSSYVVASLPKYVLTSNGNAILHAGQALLGKHVQKNEISILDGNFV